MNFLRRGVISVLVLVTGMVLPVSLVYAQDFSSLYAIPTSLKTSTQANYKFLITLTGSASWDEGETMVITFPTGYDLSAFTEDDIDVADDGTDLTTAATCAGTEHMSAAFTSTTATFTMCAGDGGTIASSSVVEIEMGVSASASGTGSNRITNPSSEARYFIALSGTFASGGSVVVPIVASSASGISVSVPDLGGGGGGGGGGGRPQFDDEEDVDEEDTVIDEEPVIEEPIVEEDGGGQEELLPEEQSGGSGASEESSQESEEDAGSGSSQEEGVQESADVSGGASQDQESEASEVVSVLASDIELPIVDNSVIALAESEVRVSLEVGEDVASVVVVLGENTYPLVQEESGVWQGNVLVGSEDAAALVVIEYASGEKTEQTLSIEVVAQGVVHAEENGIVVPVKDVRVYVDEKDLVSITGETGTFGWYVENGTYTVRAEKDGYFLGEKTVTVTNNILAPEITLVKEPEALIAQPSNPSQPSNPLNETSTIQTASPWLANISPEQKRALASGTLAVGAGIAAVVLGGGMQLWWALYAFFTQPALFFAKKRGQKLGKAYNSMKKVPLDLVTLRIFDHAKNRLIKTVVTNTQGEFFAHLPPENTYRLTAIKSGFTFPSAYVTTQEDGSFGKVYIGGEISKDAVTPVSVSVPLDPKEKSPEEIRKEKRRGYLAFGCSWISIVSAGIATVFHPSMLSGALFAMQCGVYALVWKVAHRSPPSSWGVIRDESTKEPVGNVIIRVFETKYNKLVETVLSDTRGRYACALGPNDYYVVMSKTGYLDATIRSISVQQAQGTTIFGEDILLRRGEHTP